MNETPQSNLSIAHEIADIISGQVVQSGLLNLCESKNATSGICVTNTTEQLCNDTAFLLQALKTHGISKVVVFLINSFIIAIILYRHLTQAGNTVRRIWANWWVLSMFYVLLSVASTINAAIMWILFNQKHWCAFSVYFVAFISYPLACYLLLMATEKMLVLLHPTALADRSHKNLAVLPVLLIMLYNVIILMMTKLQNSEDCSPHYEEVPVCVLSVIILYRIWNIGR